MGERSREIRIFYVDETLDALLGSVPEDGHVDRYARGYTQEEDFFVRFDEPFEIPRFPIHHNVYDHHPGPDYLDAVRKLIGRLAALAPGIFTGLTYVFDPLDVFSPSFFRLYRIDDAQYLYYLTVDLHFKPQYHEIVERGDNDITPRISSHHLFIEPLIIPLERVETIGNLIEAFKVHRTISETWIGERGRGYMLQGIWMDNGLTKFFSRLFLAEGRVLYPHYPFLCKYMTICGHAIGLSPAKREQDLPYVHAAFRFIVPEMKRIESELKEHDFSPDLDIFRRLKAEVPGLFRDFRRGCVVTPYLNEKHLKEYSIELEA